MTTLVIDRQTLPEPLLSFIGADRIKVDGEADKIVLTPATDESEPEEYDINPDDYPDTTAYFNAIPGAVERLLSYRNLPDSEFEDWDEGYCSRKINTGNRFVYEVFPNTQNARDIDGNLYDGIIRVYEAWGHIYKPKK